LDKLIAILVKQQQWRAAEENSRHKIFINVANYLVTKAEKEKSFECSSQKLFPDFPLLLTPTGNVAFTNFYKRKPK
jgi:hypothetical protein